MLHMEEPSGVPFFLNRLRRQLEIKIINMKKLFSFLVLSTGLLGAMEGTSESDMGSLIMRSYGLLFQSGIDLDCCEGPIGCAANILKYNYQRTYYESPLHPATVFGLAGCLMMGLGAASIGCTECPLQTSAVCACCALIVRKARIMEKYGLIPSHVKKD